MLPIVLEENIKKEALEVYQILLVSLSSNKTPDYWWWGLVACKNKKDYLKLLKLSGLDLTENLKQVFMAIELM